MNHRPDLPILIHFLFILTMSTTTISTIINNDSTPSAGGAHLSSCNVRPIHTEIEPTTPSTETSSPIALAGPLSSETPNDPLFAFIPPTESDSRSPCPALNTLANHGYLQVVLLITPQFLTHSFFLDRVMVETSHALNYLQHSTTQTPTTSPNY